MTIAAISIEGVLAHDRKDETSFAAQAPIMTGLRLLVAIQQMHKTALLTDETDTGPVEYFLRQNQIKGHAYLIARQPWQAALNHAELRAAQLEHLRGGLGMPVTLLLDADPSVIAQSMHKGVPGLLFAHPRFQRPEFRPDDERGVRAWDEITLEIESQRELKARDPRLEPGLGL
jgi:hypothetical protein